MLFSSKFRKRGSILIEYLVSIPLFMLMVWFPMQVSFFALSQSLAESTAMEGARYVSMELTGTNTKSISDLSNTERSAINTGLTNRLKDMSLHNPNFLLFTTNNGNPANPTMINTESTCDSYMLKTSSRKRVICFYLTTPTGSTQAQVVVRTKAPYKIVGNLIPNLTDKFFSRGTGVSVVNNPNRSGYYE